ncbi:hypothetical protein DFS34DRAFT_608849 [Phlyctochytrium arcticum]|nr:hypothetical protein DFS34DRAFT_608849 [Phlyctochytrium arcticum]
MMYISADSGIYLDTPKGGGELTRPSAVNIWDNARSGQTGIPSGFSKTFTTTRAVQMYTGSISLYASSDNYGLDVSVRIDGIVVKTFYLFWRYSGQILRFHGLVATLDLMEILASTCASSNFKHKSTRISQCTDLILRSEGFINPRIESGGDRYDFFKQFSIATCNIYEYVHIFILQANSNSC